MSELPNGSAPIGAEKVNPYGSGRRKGEEVEAMFDSIAPAYDFMNRAMTFGIDRLWRRKAVGEISGLKPQRILDVATGTGDLALQLSRSNPGAQVVGIDLSENMLEIGRRKIAAAGKENLITLKKADCLALPFADGEFDAVTVAYGVRNFEDLRRGYAEMARVLRPGGKLVVLELSVPVNPLVKPFYKFYTRCIIPMVGRLISSDSRAYSYLPESIAAMPAGERMLSLMQEAGLGHTSLRRLTFGTCTLYVGIK